MNKREAGVIGDVETLIEREHNSGIVQDINRFSYEMMDNKEDFYYELWEQLCDLELANMGRNEGFRHIINKYKLNEFQERRFLNYIKKQKDM